MDAADVFLSRASRPLIVCDIDGTLNHFAESICSALNARFGLSLVAAEVNTYRIGETLPREQQDWLAAQFCKGVFYANAVADPLAIEALRTIKDSGHRVCVATDRPESVRISTEAWVQRNGVPADSLNVGPGNKERLLAGCGPDNPGLLVDDSPEKWLTVPREGVSVWSPRHPYTPTNWQDYQGVWVFDDWAQVLDRLSIGVPA
ncbi:MULTISPECIES: HAD family hydrolase [Arthrobacter]|uniref:HAD family hydrolase n=1 Tax=Arthrobacter terricola TaxID=2547396 RepID=A0A4R5KML3_9MICC|nr:MULTISPECIES: HAD family hydrolase [Arthrobacter]MBT8160999.1 hypothetical protein [Arthrobacter sp. GN70]TDF96863.1 HAD family hydrolase [Arthrobacter terricola]